MKAHSATSATSRNVVSAETGLQFLRLQSPAATGSTLPNDHDQRTGFRDRPCLERHLQLTAIASLDNENIGLPLVECRVCHVAVEDRQNLLAHPVPESDATDAPQPPIDHLDARLERHIDGFHGFQAPVHDATLEDRENRCRTSPRGRIERYAVFTRYARHENRRPQRSP